MIKPIDDIVFVTAEEGVSAGGIIVAGHKQHVGKVEAVGPGAWYTGQDGKQYRHKPDVEVGDRVMFSHRAGMEQTVDGREYLVMRTKDIMCIIPDDAEIGLTESRKAWGM